MKRRGVENILLRRVRRHESMTALFRSHDSKRPPQLQTRLLGQVDQKEEQEASGGSQITGARPSVPATPPRSNTVARQVVPSSTSTPKPLPPLPSTPAESAPAKTPDPVWKRLQ